MSENGKQCGLVKFFNETKGFGFIAPDGGGKDVFVHMTAVTKSELHTLHEGDRVEFDTEPSKKEGKGPQAINLRVLA